MSTSRSHPDPAKGAFFTPRLLLGLVTIALAVILVHQPDQARAGSDDFRTQVDIAGDWILEGSHQVQGRHQGVARFVRQGRTPDGGIRYLYEATVRYASAQQERHVGQAILVGHDIWVQASMIRHFGGFAGQFTGSTTSWRQAQVTHQAHYRMALGNDLASGLFVERLTSTGFPVGSGPCRLTAQEPQAHALELQIDGHEFFPSLHVALASARHHINLETYIFASDDTANAVVESLADAHDRGVTVRVLLDRHGSLNRGRDAIRELRRRGVETIVSGSYTEGLGNFLSDSLDSFWGALRRGMGYGGNTGREVRTGINRDHRKLIIVDGRLAWVGGMNIADEYLNDWHDVQLAVSGPRLRDLQREFFDRWTAAGGSLPQSSELPFYFQRWSAPAGVYGGVEVQTTLPGVSSRIKDAHMQAIGQARSHVLVENPYFLDQDIIAGLSAARQRGARVVVIIPNDEDHDVPAVRDATFFIYNDLVRQGVELMNYQGRMVHTKVATVDGVWTSVGSANLDHASLHTLSEINVACHDARFARLVENRLFVPDMEASEHRGVQRVGFFSQMKKGFFHLFRNLL